MGLHRSFSGTLTRTAISLSGTQAVTGVGGRLSLIHFTGRDNASNLNNSIGNSDGTIQSCQYSSAVNLLGTLISASGADTAVCIRIADILGNGWSAVITSRDTDGFTITWTKLGAGLGITVNYTALM
jgi:hypothetical protein